MALVTDTKIQYKLKINLAIENPLIGWLKKLWNLELGTWNLELDFFSLAGFWNLGFGTWNLGFGTSDLEGTWDLIINFSRTV